MFRSACLLAAVAAFLFIPIAAAADDPVVTVQIFSDRITAAGITRGGEAIFFARSLGWTGGMRHVRRHDAIVADDDRDGVVTFVLGEDVPRASVWVIVDYETGASAVASPEGFTPRRIDLPAVVWRGGVSHVDLSRDWLDVLFVRPKVGVWTAQMWQGGARDLDGRNDANLRAGLASMKAFAGSAPAPPTATPRDVLVIIDPLALDVFARRAE